MSRTWRETGRVATRDETDIAVPDAETEFGPAGGLLQHLAKQLQEACGPVTGCLFLPSLSFSLTDGLTSQDRP